MALPEPESVERVQPMNGRTENWERSFGIDRTVKKYIGGKQARPDSGYSYPVYGRDGRLVGEAPLGNRKDVRNAVEAARAAGKWAKTTAHGRAQVLYFIAENLVQRRDEIIAKLGAVRWAGAGCDRTRRERRAHLYRTRRGRTSSKARCTILRRAWSRWR